MAHNLLLGKRSNSENLVETARSEPRFLPGNKRTRPRYAKCANCEQEFDVAQKIIGDCVYHNGELQCDYGSDMWADDDEDCHPPIDTASNRIEYPEGFYYDCWIRKILLVPLRPSFWSLWIDRNPGQLRLQKKRIRTRKKTVKTRKSQSEPEVDRDASIWDDHDEDTHREIDTEDMRDMHPEGFIYDCCDKHVDREGCETSRHIEKIPYASKRMRY
ncbi:MAG: hypothetical protein Q9221_005409 [Calogaya cf. arnoldii]